MAQLWCLTCLGTSAPSPAAVLKSWDVHLHFAVAAGLGCSMQLHLLMRPWPGFMLREGKFTPPMRLVWRDFWTCGLGEIWHLPLLPCSGFSSFSLLFPSYSLLLCRVPSWTGLSTLISVSLIPHPASFSSSVFYKHCSFSLNSCAREGFLLLRAWEQGEHWPHSCHCGFTDETQPPNAWNLLQL